MNIRSGFGGYGTQRSNDRGSVHGNRNSCQARDTSGPSTSTTKPKNDQSTPNNGTTKDAGMTELVSMMMTMLTLMMQIFSLQPGNLPTGTGTPPVLSPAPAPVIDPAKMDFDKDADLKQRQIDLIGGRNSKIDSLINTVNTSNPESPEAETALKQISDIWTQAGGDPNALKKYNALQTVRQHNSVLGGLAVAMENLEPTSEEYRGVANRMASLMALREIEIQTAKQLEAPTLTTV